MIFSLYFNDLKQDINTFR